MSILVFFFFSSRRRHTRWPRDWSSDVCSSDLLRLVFTQCCAITQVLHETVMSLHPQQRRREENHGERNVETCPSNACRARAANGVCQQQSHTSVDRQI